MVINYWFEICATQQDDQDKKKQLILLKEIIVANCETYKKQVTLSKKQFLNVSAGGTYSYHCPRMFQRRKKWSHFYRRDILARTVISSREWKMLILVYLLKKVLS